MRRMKLHNFQSEYFFSYESNLNVNLSKTFRVLTIKSQQHPSFPAGDQIVIIKNTGTGHIIH